MNKQPAEPFIVIITGPTASGKTGLSELVAESISSEIINADVGQFYARFSIGTAKPELKTYRFPNCLFDIVDAPEDISVANYRKMVIDRVNEITGRNKLPIIVGGSLFYIKSLFFPPHDYHDNNKTECVSEKKQDSQTWEALHAIDPERAQALHPNDTYRIKRALNIWYETGIKPSTMQPVFQSFCTVLFIFVCPPQDVLYNRIRTRTKQMIYQDGWIEEARGLIGTPWEAFVEKKGLIGYSDIIAWIKAGEKPELLENLVETIIIKTRQYTKRQITFWHGLQKQIIAHTQKNTQKNTQDNYPDNHIEFLTLDNLSEASVNSVISHVKNRIKTR